MFRKLRLKGNSGREDSKGAWYSALSGDSSRKTSCSGSLLELGADVHADLDGVFPIHMAAFHGSVELVEKLLAAGALADFPDEQGYTPMHHVMNGVAGRVEREYGNLDAARYRSGDYQDIAFQLLEFDIDLEGEVPGGTNYFNSAVLYGWADVVQKMIEKGVDVSKADSQGKTALDFAIENKRDGIAELIKKVISEAS